MILALLAGIVIFPNLVESELPSASYEEPPPYEEPLQEQHPPQAKINEFFVRSPENFPMHPRAVASDFAYWTSVLTVLLATIAFLAHLSFQKIASEDFPEDYLKKIAKKRCVDCNKAEPKVTESPISAEPGPSSSNQRETG